MNSRFIVLFLTLAVFGCAINTAPVKDKSFAQLSFKAALEKYDYHALSYFESQDFVSLVEYLHKLEKKSADDPEVDIKFSNELDSIGYSILDYSENIESLKKQYPDDFMSYLVRSRYFLGKAWQTRGISYIDKINNQTIDSMNHYRALALNDIEKSIGISANCFECYLVKAQIHQMVGGEHKDAFGAFAKAYELRPQSFPLNNLLIHFSTPRWGGSIEKMQEYIDRNKKYYDENPSLKLLESTILEEMADQNAKSDINKAIKLYQQAIDVGDRDRVRADLAELQLSIGNNVDACVNLSMAIQLNPPRWWAHELMENCHK